MENTPLVKLFVGYPCSSDLLLHLKKSHAWQTKTEKEISLIAHEKKQYIGFLLTNTPLPLNTLNELESSLQESLETYIPSALLETLKLHFFPQVLLF